jgi:hypothetical protein
VRGGGGNIKSERGSGKQDPVGSRLERDSVCVCGLDSPAKKADVARRDAGRQPLGDRVCRWSGGG